MQTVQLNIGLNTNLGTKLSNNFTNDLVKFTLDQKLYINSYKSRLDFSQTEQTLVISFKTLAPAKYIYPIIEFLGDALLQDFIAIKVDDSGKLIYSNNSKNDWGEFNEAYFINY